MIIALSILSADLSHLQDEVDTIEQHADWLQIDVMDGHFVPNLSFGAPVIKNLKTKLLLDIHLMVENPEERVEEFLAVGAKHITFHAEVTDPEERSALIAAIHDGGATAGIAINPETPVEHIEGVLPDVDLILIMSVDPGFGGQKFMTSVLDKVRVIRGQYPRLMIQVDGGIDDQTAKQCTLAGANNLVSGSFIFGAKDRVAAIASLRGT
ncbi:ribulose-phosphate 3-epimerase [Candidatus Peregrinibacteria bacterium CG10_big_fil_rev_8_21_14_0_10_49_16]|nr:MAG: ribulose-phosphate 3-epimerase [Candidatus Peregrinibacteria bacterium CG22_combo_CG10-13_8_21_14_all_49_11]PIR51797.1 MAG: ribulose-phosphate 3-epimerase [Candidatus Peregrinibacteria bacterium CG10_big_fil_rev_8_21_14_0_10_49_16]